MLGNQDTGTSYFSDDEDSPSRQLGSLVSKASPASLVGMTAAPPDSPPAHEVGRSTPLTGSLAAAPSQAQAKNKDSGTGYDTGISTPPDGGNVNSVVSPARPLQPAGPAPLMPAGVGGLQPAMPSLPATTPQQVVPDRLNMLTQQDQQKLSQLQSAPTGGKQIQNRWGRILGQIGDVAGSVLAPGVTQYIPGSTLNQQRLIGRQQGIVGSDQAQQQARATLEDTQSQAAQRTAQAGANTPRPVTADEAKAAGNASLEGSIMRPSDIGRLNTQTVKNTGTANVADIRAIQTAAGKGQRPVDPSDLSKGYEDDTDSQAFKNQQALNGYRQTMGEVAQINADVKKQGITPGTPAWTLAQQKIQSATMRGQAMLMNAVGGNKGTDLQGNPLPGAMITDSGVPVGAHFQANVRPTGQQRGKGNMATSAEEQLNDIKTIIQKHPTMFGPGYGQASEFKKWIGSQDPDAQKFLSARTIAADHLAASFGGRSEPALAALDSAVGQFKDNPKAALAGIDQLLKANKIFKDAGAMKTVGSDAAAPPPLKPAGPQKFDWSAHPKVNP